MERDWNTLLPMIHKNKAFIFEDEIRLIYEIESPSSIPFNWSIEPNTGGKYIETNLGDLIDEIVIGPKVPKWLAEAIKDICLKYGMDKKFTVSILT